MEGQKKRGRPRKVEKLPAPPLVEAQEKRIRLPYGFIPREYQLPIFTALDNGIKRAVLLWHRRSGKDLTMLNYSIKKAYQRVGVYYHLLPTFTQGKRIIWDGIDDEGRKFLDYIPKELIDRKNDTEMKIVLKNGSIYQIIGTDQFNGVVGPNPIGCVFSEYSLQNPMAWDLIRPILAENQGWAVFIYTPRGKNHGFDMYETARRDLERWFVQRLTVNDTKRDDNSPVVTKEIIAQEIKDGMDPDLAQQEFYCSFNSPMQGSYFGRLIEEARNEKRIGLFPWDKTLQVSTWWDLGIDDSVAVWFTQAFMGTIRFIDYLEERNKGIEEYGPIIQQRGYTYDAHNFPHDAEARELTSGKSVIEICQGLFKPVTCIVHPRPKDHQAVLNGLSACRAILPKCYFNEDKCLQGIRALESYHKEYDQKLRTFKDNPCHDWSSHAADAFRLFAERFRSIRSKMQTHGISEFDVLNYEISPQLAFRQAEVVSEYDVFT